MSPARRRCSADEKWRAVEMVLAGGLSPAAVARETGVNAGSLRQWVRDRKVVYRHGDAAVVVMQDRQGLDNNRSDHRSLSESA
jgi:transposase-like protein